MADDYATKSDLGLVRDDLRSEIVLVRDDIRALGIMVERTQSNISAVIEVLSETASKSDVRKLEERLTRGLSLVEEVVGDTSGNVQKNSKDLRLLRNEVVDVKKRLTRVEHAVNGKSRKRKPAG